MRLNFLFQNVEFETRQSGILTAKKSTSMKNGVEMRLPINAPFMNIDSEDTSAPIWNLVKTVFAMNPDLKPKHVRLSPTTKKLLIRLQDGTSRVSA
jgi:hypothetical protein